MRLIPRVVALVAAATAIALVAPPAYARRTITLKFPKFDVPPRSDLEYCTFVPLPMDGSFDVAGYSVVNVGVKKTFTSHHFLMWVYNGKDAEAFPPQGTLVDSKACLDFGPADTNSRTLIAGSQVPRLVTRLPVGLAQRMTPVVNGSGQKEIGIILNTHWINAADKPQRAGVRVKLMAARKGTLRQLLLPIFEVAANGSIYVPPGQVKTETAMWQPGNAGFGAIFGGGSVPNGPACVVNLTSHMHKRGKQFTIEMMNGAVATEQLLDTTSYSDPPRREFTPPMLVTPAQGLRYTCTHDNGVATPQKMGCEETASVPPGISAVSAFLFQHKISGAAKRCETDADCAGFGTGKCVRANLVFGFTSDDDMCIMPGAYYPANAQGNCSLRGLDIIN